MSRTSQRILVVDPDPARGMELYAALRDLRAEAELAAGGGEEGWRRFAQLRPEVVLIALGTPGRGADLFLRRLREEYMGAPPAVFMLCEADELPRAATLEPDAFLVPPISRAALAQVVSQGARVSGPDPLVATRLRALYDLTMLGADPIRGLDAVAARTALAFQVPDCAVWAASPAEAPWPRTARPIPEAERGYLLARVRAAAEARGAVHGTVRAGRQAVTDDPGHSLLALPLRSGELVLGGIALIGEGSRLYSQGERDALALVARRLAGEMAWVSAHSRLLAEHERLREAALLDPLTGVWNRSALEQAVVAQIQAAARTGQPLALLVVDVMRLAAINDRHGHLVGDAVLAHLAGLLAANLRAHDIVGRVAGDEFAVLLVGSDADGARAAADHLRAAVATYPYRSAEHSVEFAIRCGVSQLRPGETSGAAALARAESALRRARRRSTQGLLPEEPADTDPRGLRPLGHAGDSLPPGITLGGMYRVLHEISRGAMGVVYRGEDLGLGRPIALKLLRSDLARDSELVARFRAEASMLASLHHPNLVQVHALGTEGELVYFVMELVEGEAVADGMARAETLGQPVEISAVAKVVDEIASALEAIHAVGIVHRDVKPDNVLLDRVHDRAVLVDVGVAKRQGGQREAAGTPGYAAPESFMDRDPTPAIDVYGLAATAYAMLTGLPPFGAGDLLPVFERQVQERPAPPSALREGLSSQVDEVLLRALSPEPADRPQSASAFSFALLRALEHSAEAAAEADWLSMSGMSPVPELDEDGSDTQRYHVVRVGSSGLAHGPLECRNVFFRAAYPMFGRRRGTGWLLELARESPALGQLLRLTVPARGWNPVGRLSDLVRRSCPGDEERSELARELGHAAFGVGFEALEEGERPAAGADVLARTAELWERFWRGSKLQVERAAAGELRVAVDPGSGSPLVCAVIEGWLARLAELAGGTAVVVEHAEHSADGGGPCRFAARWTALAIG